MQTIIKNKIRRKHNNKRRNNAILYPIYKAFSWDLLCYYSIEYLFLTITKGVSPSKILVITAIYVLAKLLFEIPSVILSEYIGKRKSLIIGNLFVFLGIILLILSSNFIMICIYAIFAAIGYDIKAICDGNLLYDSVATKGGDGLYTKLESKGATAYYVIDATLSLTAGYLFVINNYIPLIICAICLLISLILSIKLEDININKKKKAISTFIKEYKSDITSSFKFIKKSNRMKSFVIFGAVFYSLIKTMDTYKNNLLTELNVSAEQFSVIIASLSLIAAISSAYTQKLQDRLKNKMLTFISLTYILSWIIIAIISINFYNTIALPIILILYVINKIDIAQWYIVKERYLRNFTREKTRPKITLAFELISCLSAVLISLIGSKILEKLGIKNAILLFSLSGLAVLVVTLDYMRKRFGLRPKEYKKEDIKFTY